MDQSAIQRPRRILWLNVLTVLSAAILISAEVFGAAFAGSWAIASLFALGALGARVLHPPLILLGIALMVQFGRAARPGRPLRPPRLSGDGPVRPRRAPLRAVHRRLRAPAAAAMHS